VKDLGGLLFFTIGAICPERKPNPEFCAEFFRGTKARSGVSAGTRQLFGCGSSRWNTPPGGVKGLWFSAWSSPPEATPTFFYNNCFKNGILPATLSERAGRRTLQGATEKRGRPIRLDPSILPKPDRRRQTRPPDVQNFEIAPSRKEGFAEGTRRHRHDDCNTSRTSPPTKDARRHRTMYESVDVKYYSNGR